MQIACVSCKRIMKVEPPANGMTIPVICSFCSCSMNLQVTQNGSNIISRAISSASGKQVAYMRFVKPAGDYEPKESPQVALARLTDLLKLREEEEDFEQCAIIRDQIKELAL